MKKLKIFQENFKNYLQDKDLKILDSIIPGGTLSSQEALDVYAQGYIARLIEMLGNTFEATWWILGDEYFFDLGKKFIKETPSVFQNIMEYGENFPAFLQNSFHRHKETPYLVELSKFEWKISALFHQHDPLEHQSLLTLTQEALLETKLQLRPTHFFTASEFRIAHLWSHRNEKDRSKIIDEINQPERSMIFRQDFTIYTKSIEIWQQSLLEEFKSPQTLPEALSKCMKHHEITPIEIQDFFSFIKESDLLAFRAY